VAERRVWIDAPAKINLTLDVLHRRADGYHALETVMQAIDLVDRLQVEVRAGDSIEVSCSDPGLPVGLENLAGRAAAAFLGACRCRRAVQIDIQKNIPAGAGLGGGSSDAAATLLALDRMLDRPLGARRLHDLAASLGSDVPFFLVGGLAFCWGRGEHLRSLPPRHDLVWALLVPEVSVKSSWAYNSLNIKELTSSKRSSRMLVTALRESSKAAVGAALGNQLEPVVQSEHAVVAEIVTGLPRRGALGTTMTGSGGGVVGLFDSDRAARAAVDAFRGAGTFARVVRPRPRGHVIEA
jgi:4-diphosphocytidyl-2-C-methyl-D-erythritol kinase